MNYDFLQSYNIPIARKSTDNQYANTNRSTMDGTYTTPSNQSAAAVNTAYYGYGGSNSYNESYESAGNATGSSGDYYQNPERFIPPSKHGTGYVSHRTPFKRKITTGAGGSAAKKEPPIAETSSDGKLLIFLGRDESYPDELNSLIHPLSCDLCNMKMNSRMIAKDHYESKAHDKHISAWLFKNFNEKCINSPLVKRFIEQEKNVPDNLCSETVLKLTPLAHEHYPVKKRPCKINIVGGASATEKQNLIAKVTSYEKLEMSLGRHESYPVELNLLIHPLSCDLCNLKMNSRMSAKDHYTSRAHDNHISSWLLKNYTEKGINPPSVKRFITQGSTGPDAYYCEYCDLKLTSLTHANQHFSGKKHRLVIAQRAKPSGAGFYNSEGKWVRTGTKVIPNHMKDNNFGIGEQFAYAEILKSAQSINSAKNPPLTTTTTTTSAADTTTTTNESEIKTNIVDATKTALTSSSDQDPAVFCSICKVSVTSAVQMTMHLSGSKHTKKLKLAGLNPTPATDNNAELQAAILPPATITDNVLFSAIKEEIKPDPTDLSMYRTPSGQYYCKTCNISMPHLPGLEQHLKGKRHLKKQTEDKAMASLAAKKTK